MAISAGANPPHGLPAALADMRDVVGLMVARLGGRDEIATETLVDEKAILQ